MLNILVYSYRYLHNRARYTYMLRGPDWAILEYIHLTHHIFISTSDVLVNSLRILCFINIQV